MGFNYLRLVAMEASLTTIRLEESRDGGVPLKSVISIFARPVSNIPFMQSRKDKNNKQSIKQSRMELPLQVNRLKVTSDLILQ